MNIQPKTEPKTEPGLPPSFSPTNPNNTFQQKTIPELINVLRATCKFDTFDLVESVLVSREMGLRDEIEQLHKNFEMEKLKFLEKLQMETLLRIQGEEEFRKRKKDELCEKGKRVQESYEALLKEVKTNGLVYRDTVDKLRNKNDELDCEVKKLKEKFVDDGKRFDVIRRENEELGCEVLELRKMKEKWVGDSNELCVLRGMIGKLEQEVFESKKMKEKWLDDSSVLDEFRIKVERLEKENSELGDKKREVEALYESLNTKYGELSGRVSRLEDDTKLLMSLDGSGAGHNEGEPHANPLVTDFGDNGEEDARDSALGNDIVEETAPLTRNGAAHQSPEVAASTQPRNVGGKDGQGASSARGRGLPENAEVIDLDDEDDDNTLPISQGIHRNEDDDDDDNRPISQGVRGKKAVFGVALKNENPSSPVATQEKSKFSNAADTVKRKFPFTVIETSSSSSSGDSSFMDDLPIISSLISQAKQQKM